MSSKDEDHVDKKKQKGFIQRKNQQKLIKEETKTEIIDY